MRIICVLVTVICAGCVSQNARLTAPPTSSTVNGMKISGGTPAEIAGMLALQKSWFDSYLSGDLDTLMTLHNDETVMMPRRTPSLHGVAAARAFFASRLGKYDIEFHDDPKELEINGNWAFLHGEFSLTGTPKAGGELFQDRGRYFVLYKKDADGNWKIYRDIDNSLPQ